MICKDTLGPGVSAITATGIMVVLLMLFFLQSASMAESETRTVATGTAMIRGGNIAGARQDATMDALRQALEQGVGMFMDSKTILENENLMETIYTNTRGYISSYDIISEGERGGLYRVKIQAVLKKDAIRSTLTTLGIIKAMMDYPRIMIMAMPDQGVSPISANAGTILVRNFTARHFDVVDPAQSRRLHTEAARLIKTGSVKNVAAELGLKHDAEIVLLYGTTSGNPEYDGIMESVPVSMSAQAIVTTTAQVLAAQEKTVQGVGNSPELAARNGVTRAADALSDYMIKAVASWWDDYTANGLPYTVTLHTPRSADTLVLDFEDTLRQIRGVVSVAERSSGGGITEMMVKFKGSNAGLRSAVLGALRGQKGFRKLHLVSSRGRNIVFSTR